MNNGIIIILGGAGFCPSTVGTNISPPKGTLQDDYPFTKVGYVSLPGG